MTSGPHIDRRGEGGPVGHGDAGVVNRIGSPRTALRAPERLLAEG
jgi:hypothetical protein